MQKKHNYMFDHFTLVTLDLITDETESSKCFCNISGQSSESIVLHTYMYKNFIASCLTGNEKQTLNSSVGLLKSCIVVHPERQMLSPPPKTSPIRFLIKICKVIVKSLKVSSKLCFSSCSEEFNKTARAFSTRLMIAVINDNKELFRPCILY